MRRLRLSAILLFAFSSLSTSAEPDPLAILHRECVSCHTESKRKGGLLIDSRESLLKGGDTDAAIVPGNSGGSYLVESLFPDAYSHMPPKGQLNPKEIIALEEWIDEGAPWDADKWAKLNLPERTEVTTAGLPERYVPVLAMALSPDQSTLAVGRGNAIDWYRVVAGEGEAPPLSLEHAATSEGHADVVQSLAFSPDGKTLASGGFRSLLLWNTQDPTTPATRLEKPFLGRQTALVFLKAPDRLLVADSLPSQLGRLHEIDLATEKVRSFDTAHLDSIFGLFSSPDGKRYATTSADKLVTIRDAGSHEIVGRLEGHTGYVLTAAFDPEGKRIATAGDDEEVKVWNLETGKKVSAFASKRSGPLYGLAWLKDPENEKKKAAEKDADKAAEINADRIFAIPESGKPAAFTNLNEHEGAQRSTGAKESAFDTVGTPLFALAVHPKRQWSFAGGEDGRLFAWDENGKLKQTLDPPAGGLPLASPNE
ncbi:MAG: c-type cytochrome domain-containing protein [Verrucomicrobiales bacterium]